MIKSDDDCLMLQTDIDAISEWSMQNKLLLHEDKTLCVRFRSAGISSSVTYQYNINGVAIEDKSTCRDLGVFFSSDLTWSIQIEKVLLKAYKTLFLIKRSFSNTTITFFKRQLYH